MSIVESPQQTLYRFTQEGWLDESTSVIAKDLLTSGNESNREWDAFYYEEKDGVLFDPVRQKPIIGTDGSDEAQKNVNKELEEWFLNHDSGIAVRISPSGGKWSYPDEQIEIYRIAYEWPNMQKRLLCSYHQFHARFRNPEEIRRFIFAEEDKESSIFEIINWIERISNQKIKTDIENLDKKNEQAYYYATLIKSGVNPYEVFDQMKLSGFLGENPIGCVSSGNGVTMTQGQEYFTNISDQIESSFPCPRCHGAIPSGRGITTCPHCGLTKEQAGSTCG